MGRNAALLQPPEPALGAAPHPVELLLQLSTLFPQLFGPALDIGDCSGASWRLRRPLALHHFPKRLAKFVILMPWKAR